MIVQDQPRASIPVAVNPPSAHELAVGPGVFEHVAESFLAASKRESVLLVRFLPLRAQIRRACMVSYFSCCRWEAMISSRIVSSPRVIFQLG